jgi:histidinol-phosphate phosphatase family protein
MVMTQVVILAGGAGTRLRAVTGDLPKPLAPVCGNTLLGRQLEMIAASGIRDVIVLSGFAADRIAQYCGDGSRWALDIRCIAEQSPRGTAGAVIDALDQIAPRFIVMYADTVLDVDLHRLLAAHERGQADASVFLHPNDHPFDSDLVEVDGDDFVRRLHPYPHPPGEDLPNLVNAGLYVFERSALARTTGLPDRADFGKHVFSRMLDLGMRIFGYRSSEYIKDAGTPERLAKVARDIESGRVESLSFRKPGAAVFLDRDGVLNDNEGYVSRPEDLKLFPGVAGAVARLNHSPYRSVIITNQPVIARGDCTEDDLARIHARLDALLALEGAYVDRLYYCPHHPDGGFPGEVAHLKIACGCRKPETGLVDRAADEMGIDFAQSWFIGDATSDMELARRRGLRFMLVRTGLAGRDGKYPGRPDFVAPDLPAAIGFILDTWPELRARAQDLAKDIRPGQVIAIGGLARSGKSSLASELKYALRDRSIRAVVAPLDNWLRSAPHRGEGVRGRYDIPGLEAALTDLIDQRGAISSPRYDPLLRESLPNRESIAAAPEDVIIIDGIPSLLSEPLLAKASMRLFVDCDEGERRRRIEQEYTWRGFSKTDIEALNEARSRDEAPLVRAAAERADIIFSSGGQ